MFRAVRFRVLFLLLILTLPSLAGTGLDPREDTFAFANETFWAYNNQRSATPANTGKAGAPKPAAYSRRCFVLCRAVMQFYQFAEFAPQEPKLDEAGYRALVRRICRVPVSQKRNSARIRVPGFANLQQFSDAWPRLLQQELGNWWPTYFRFGNWRMALPFPRGGQEKLARKVEQEIAAGHLVALYITRFKPLNHCLVVHACRRTAEGLVFSVYDPNFIGQVKRLKFDARTRSFLYEKTWYFPGGGVNALRVYHNRVL